MKKIVTLFAFIPLFGIAQIGHQKQAEISGGYEVNGFWGKGSFGYYLDEGSLIRISGQLNFEKFTIESAKGQDEKVQLYILNPEYYKRVYSTYSNDLSLYVGGGFIIAYENIEDEFLTDGAKINAEDKLIYGGNIGVELDKYLFQVPFMKHGDVNFFISAKVNYLPKSDVGEIQPNLGGGLKLFF